MPTFGVLGGSGLDQFEGLQLVREEQVHTPFGDPSAPLFIGKLGETELVFLARHGRGHTFTPSEVPYRANIYAMRKLGVTHLLSVSAVGSLQEQCPPGSAVIPNQIIDQTRFDRPRTFFDQGIVAHAGIADPFCASFRTVVRDIASECIRDVHDGGTYVAIEGPQFSTRAESDLHRSWGATVVGMTAMPEARLAREAGLCFSMLALVTDFDVWHESEDDVSVEMVHRVLSQNSANARTIVRKLVESGLPDCESACEHAMDDAVITHPDAISAEARARVQLLLEPRA